MPQMPNPPEAPIRGNSARLSDEDAATAALARLASTRQRLLLTIAPHRSGNGSQPPSSAPWVPRRWRALGRMLISRGPSAAVLRAASAAASQWWHAQPWAAATGMFGNAVAQEVKPLVRRYPWATIAAALGVGAAVVWARPWLWRVSRPYIAPLGGSIRRGAWSLLTQAPVQMAITAVLAAWIGEQQRDAAPQTDVHTGPARAPENSPDPA